MSKVFARTLRLLPIPVALAVAAIAMQATSRPATAPSTAFGAVGRWITYPDGRVFIPHGLNSVVTAPPYYNDRLSVADARFLANEGFTALRLAVLPEALEPTVGAIDAGYVDRFAEQTALLGRDGIATVLDLNQDRYASICAGDGFPSWAVVGTCADDLALSGVAAWRAFWDNTAAADEVGIQDHYLGWWKVIASRFAGSRSLLGYDLLNEPKVVDDTTLAGLWQRSLGAVRAADKQHVGFIEPRDPAHPGFDQSFAAGTGFTGHVYCAKTLWKELARRLPSRAEIAGCIRDDAVMLGRQLAYATSAGQAYLVGEFGASGELREQRALVDAMGTRFVPWLGYAYNAARDSSGGVSQGILRDESRHGSEANAKQAKLDALVVPYPMAVAGTPRSWRFDRSARTVTFRYSTQRVGGGSFAGAPPTVVFIPQRVYRTGYAVRVTGARVASKPTSPWLKLVADRGAGSVSVTIRPRQGSTTLTPLQVDQCGFDLGHCG
jgi:endoglycosylceramidase